MDHLNHLDQLEAESIYILREAAAQFRKPVLLFSGGKDSLTLLRLSEKAFRPYHFPFPILHIDTGHNFPETLLFRDQTVLRLGEKLIVKTVDDSIKRRRVKETGVSRNSLQTVTLLDALLEFGFEAAIGGARRDEEKARAKERVFSHRNRAGMWDPSNQRPELWNLYNGRMRKGEQMRVFPLSNWTELDVWAYAEREKLELPSLYFSHLRECFERDGVLIPVSYLMRPQSFENVKNLKVRFRTVGDMTCSAAVESTATSINEIMEEIILCRRSERSGRIDDKLSRWSMEERKRVGYF